MFDYLYIIITLQNFRMQPNQLSYFCDNTYAYLLFYQYPIINTNQHYDNQTPSLFQFYKEKSEQNIQNLKTCEKIEEYDNTKYKKNQKIRLRKKISKQNKFIDNSISEQYSEYKIDINQRINKKKLKRSTKKRPPKQQRNIIPNLIQQLFSFLSKKTKSEIAARKALNVLKNGQLQELEIKRYFIFQKNIKQILDRCVNMYTLQILSDKDHPKLKEIKICFNENEIVTYQKVSRMLTSYFFTQISPLLTLHSKRISSQQRINHLFHRRLILKFLATPI